MLGKIINGELITPNEYERRKIVITNPSDESLKFNLGYKEVTIEAEPEYNPETQYINPVYSEAGEEIIQSWEVLDIPEVTGNAE